MEIIITAVATAAHTYAAPNCMPGSKWKPSYEPILSVASVTPSTHSPVSAQRDEFPFGKSSEARVVRPKVRRETAGFNGHLHEPHTVLRCLAAKRIWDLRAARPRFKSRASYATHFLYDLGEVTEPF